jgi:hypothetical protein
MAAARSRFSSIASAMTPPKRDVAVKQERGDSRAGQPHTTPFSGSHPEFLGDQFGPDRRLDLAKRSARTHHGDGLVAGIAADAATIGISAASATSFLSSPRRRR